MRKNLIRFILNTDDDGLESVGDGCRTPTMQLRGIERLRLEDEGVTSGSEDERDVSTPPPHGGSVRTPNRRLKERQRKMDKYAERTKEAKNVVNLVVVGHVDSGKSTLMGHLLYKTGNVTKKAMHKFEQVLNHG